VQIAVVGTGISGLSAAWLLSKRHDVRVFEREERLGGHTNSVAVVGPRGPLPLDTGFVVFNRETYPNLVKLFDVLGVASRESDMSFSVSCRRCALEYSGSGFSGLFAQRKNLWSLPHLSMLKEIARFNRIAPELLSETKNHLTVGRYLDRELFGEEMRRHYLLPMAAAVWSSGTLGIEAFPASMLVRFFKNHGFLGVDTQFRWRTVTGGSRAYVEALTRSFRDRIHAGSPVTSIRRDAGDAVLSFTGGGTQRFDAVVVATHADEALKLLQDPSPDERRLLSAWSYSKNDTFLHTDRSFLPETSNARASWNYHLRDCAEPKRNVAVTYYLNRLQALSEPTDYLVTLNPEGRIAEESILRRMTYTHPVYTLDSLDTQAELPALNGQRGTYYCGAYFGYGFHEDGLKSGIAVAERLGVRFP